MQEGEPGHTVKKCHNCGRGLQTLLVRLPRRQGAAGHRKPRSGLALRDALGLEITILHAQIGTCETLPALVASIVASGLFLDSCSHRCLLVPPCALIGVMAQDDEATGLFQLCVVPTTDRSGPLASPSGRRGDRGQKKGYPKSFSLAAHIKLHLVLNTYGVSVHEVE